MSADESASQRIDFFSLDPPFGGSAKLIMSKFLIKSILGLAVSPKLLFTGQSSTSGTLDAEFSPHE
jgi:hypothetical protein